MNFPPNLRVLCNGVGKSRVLKTAVDDALSSEGRPL
jgi:hypothetical protein